MHTAHQYRAAIPGVEAVRLRSDRQFPRHSHDQFGIGMITSGGHRSWSSIGWVDAVCGDIIMVNPGEMHDGSSLDGSARGWKMLFVEPELVYGIFGEEIPTHNVDLRPNVCDRDQRIRLGRLFNAVTTPKPENLDIEECLLQTLSYAFRHHGSQRPSRLPALPNVNKVVRLIDSEPHRSWSLEEMARMVGVSRFHFLRGFACTTGATPHAYIVQQRVRFARRLLVAGIELAQASIEAGFADQSHMTRAFVRQFGTTPARYRQAVCDPKARAISFKTKRVPTKKFSPMIRLCGHEDFEAIWEIINDGAEAYKGMIPVDCFHDPYMTRDQLQSEIAAGVVFWGVESKGTLQGVMGIQDVKDVTLIRHAYVRTSNRRCGVGGQLLEHLQALTNRPILIGTWADANWAIHFYAKHGFSLAPADKKNRLLQGYWNISARQIETSVVFFKGELPNELG